MVREIRYVGPASEHLPDSACLQFVIDDIEGTTARAAVIVEAASMEDAIVLTHRLLDSVAQLIEGTG